MITIGAMDTDKRELTYEELEAARKLRSIWDARKKEKAIQGIKLTQENVGLEMNITQGQVGKYLNGLAPLNVTKVLEFARILEVEPTDIMPSFQFGDYKFSASKVSEDTNGLNRFILNTAYSAANEINKERKLNLPNETVTDYAAQAYEALEEYEDDVTKNTIKLVLSILMPKKK